MESNSTNINKCATVVAEILLAYKNYVEFGYPKDPNIYEVRAGPTVKESLEEYITFIKFKGGSEWPFKIIEDSSVRAEEIFFGPERVNILWRDDYGM